MGFTTPGGASIVQTPWLAQTDVLIYNALPAPAGVYQSAWFDKSNLKRINVEVLNTTGQPAAIQIIGNSVQSVEIPARLSARNIGAPVVCVAGGAIDIGEGINDDWHKFIGVLITTIAPAPIAGVLAIKVSSQK